ncbi:iron-containing redox enzyme family protein [Streptomyces sp. NBC_01190]|uniref:iron-containing redox enzyme family protein n=1 Tax=Streptomyces sp. NBC_01190 TaxID=2903767 RepID=UPI0038638222|nr:iron-containing redox enzyme family protein [Streptomyces sp. NBC_01190]
MTTFREPRAAAPALPADRGHLSSAVLGRLRGEHGPPPPAPAVASADPYGDDLQLALYTLYELHYQGFEGVDDDQEWDPGLLNLRQALEGSFLAALRAGVPGTVSASDALGRILVEPVEDEGDGVGHYLRDEAAADQVREYAALRSLYHLKEADPHAWVIPRLHGPAKAAMVAVEFDEFGAGRAEHIHARLYAELMLDLGLDTAYGRYLDAAPAEALATVNLMSLFGLHRALRGALIGHFAAVEITSSPGSRRLAQAMRRIGAGPAAARFYEEHVEADAVHEQVVKRQVIAPLLAAEPRLEADVAFGIEATGLLDERLGEALLRSWRGSRSALRLPLAPDGG